MSNNYINNDEYKKDFSYNSIDDFSGLDLPKIKGTISFKESADRKNELIYRTTDKSKYNYVIPDVQSWKKDMNGNVLVQCGSKTYLFEDFALKDKQLADLIKTDRNCSNTYAVARVGATYDKDINFMDVAGFVEKDPKTGEIKELKPHQFDLCNKNHFIVGKVTDSELKDMLFVCARDVYKFVETAGEFIFSYDGGTFATKGLEYDLEKARGDLWREGLRATPEATLLQMSANIGKPIVLLTSESHIHYAGTPIEVQSADFDEQLVGARIEISGKRYDVETRDVLTDPETTKVHGIAKLEMDSAEMTIIEGDDFLYVTVDRYRELVLERTRDYGDDKKPPANEEKELICYAQIIQTIDDIEKEFPGIDGPEIYPGPGIEMPEIETFPGPIIETPEIETFPGYRPSLEPDLEVYMEQDM